MAKKSLRKQMKRKIIASSLLALSLIIFSGCSGKEVTLENMKY